MKRRANLILTGLSLLFSSHAAGAPAPFGIKVSGGISVSAFRETKSEKGTQTKLKLEDTVLEIKGNRNSAGFDIALGTLLLPTVLSSVDQKNKGNFGLNRENDRAGLLWGAVNLKPAENLKLEAGILPTNVGYELAESYRNFNITYGLVWNSQPFIYRGVRATYTFNESFQVYGEYDRGKELNGSSRNHALALGISGALSSFYYTFSYFDYGNYKNIFDFSLSTSCKNLKMGINGDYQWLDGKGNRKGYGVAIYIVPEFKEFSLPIRVEMVKDTNSSSIYGFSEKTYSFTLTPTYNLSSNTTIRVEYSLVKSENGSAFNGSDHKETFSFQLLLNF